MRRPFLRSKTHVVAAWLALSAALAPRTGAQTCGTGAEESPAAARASLAATEQDASVTMSGMGFGETLPGIVDADGAVLIANVPVIRGRENVLRVLTQSPYRKAGQRWQPLRVIVSRDGTLGATFGITLIETGLGEPSKLGRYITVWRCGALNSWQIVGHVDVRSAPPALRLPADLSLATADTEQAATARDAFARADIDFARLAADSGAPTAFARFAAPDAIMFSGSEITIGPANIRSRMLESRPGAQWRWRPVLTFNAASGDLGATIGEAEIRPPNGAPVYSKYLTVWQKQPDGSLKFVVDAGNARPAR